MNRHRIKFSLRDANYLIFVFCFANSVESKKSPHLAVGGLNPLFALVLGVGRADLHLDQLGQIGVDPRVIFTV